MPDITIHPHGKRWALLEAGAESPIKEFGTEPTVNPDVSAVDAKERVRSLQTGL
jgi:hypothetical protein